MVKRFSSEAVVRVWRNHAILKLLGTGHMGHASITLRGAPLTEDVSVSWWPEGAVGATLKAIKSDLWKGNTPAVFRDLKGKVSDSYIGDQVGEAPKDQKKLYDKKKTLEKAGKAFTLRPGQKEWDKAPIKDLISMIKRGKQLVKDCEAHKNRKEFRKAYECKKEYLKIARRINRRKGFTKMLMAQKAPIKDWYVYAGTDAKVYIPALGRTREFRGTEQDEYNWAMDEPVRYVTAKGTVEQRYVRKVCPVRYFGLSLKRMEKRWLELSKDSRSGKHKLGAYNSYRMFGTERSCCGLVAEVLKAGGGEVYAKLAKPTLAGLLRTPNQVLTWAEAIAHRVDDLDQKAADVSRAIMNFWIEYAGMKEGDVFRKHWTLTKPWTPAEVKRRMPKGRTLGGKKNYSRFLKALDDYDQNGWANDGFFRNLLAMVDVIETVDFYIKNSFPSIEGHEVRTIALVVASQMINGLNSITNNI